MFTHSRVKIPEASTPGVEVTAAVARYKPRTKKFEVFADGTSNPWGVDFDDFGAEIQCLSQLIMGHLTRGEINACLQSSTRRIRRQR